ncbi:hypothetical protein RND81_03G120900 [Saponaria officinalis]|uniref:EF-hand domain-containing protein n=1 Tax=Saponaria officinalis TaxID=3572 RepID=A0AAW1LZR1_SAPOF
MLGIKNLYKLVMRNVVHHPLGVVPHTNTNTNTNSNSTLSVPCKTDVAQAHDSMAKALIAVFGMDKNGKIAMDKASKVVKQLGLVKEDDEEDEKSNFDNEDMIEAKNVIKGLEDDELEMKEKELLLRQVFLVFDEDEDGFIDAKEIMRIFVCLGLDNGWSLSEIENMIRVVDLNLDGKVDFHEFQLMMG